MDNNQKNEDVPTRYRAEFIEPGIISYEDINAGKVFVSREALDRMRESFIGKPVVNVEHIDYEMIDAFKLNDEDSKSKADGIVAAVGKLENGWDYADLLIWNKETKKNIDKNGFTVSCSYVPTEIDGKGAYHGIDYDEEVVNGKYTHMAIVATPRYEKSKIYQNAKGGYKVIFKLIGKKKENKKNADPPEDKEKKENKEEETIDINNAMIETENGEQIPMDEMIKNWKKTKENECGPKKMNMTDEVDVDGKKVSVKDLYDNWKKSNSEPATDDKLEKVVDDTKQNSKPPTTKEPEKNNNFRKIENAAGKENPAKINILTKEDRLKRGQQRYGKRVEVKTA